jgi:hypothetical protein
VIGVDRRIYGRRGAAGYARLESRAQLAIEALGFRLGGDAQLGLQGAAAGGVLAQGGGALPVLGEQAHEVAVGLLVPRLELDAAAGEGDCLGQPVALRAGEGEDGEEGGGLAPGPLGDELRPVVEGRAVVQEEAFEEATLVEGNGRHGFLLGGPVAAEGQGDAAAQPAVNAVEGADIAPDGGAAADADGLAADVEEGWAAVLVGDDAAEVAEGAAQVGAGVGLRAVGPEEGGEGFATVGAAGLDGKVGEERAHFVGLELGQGLPVEVDLEAAEEVDVEMGHVRSGAGVLCDLFIIAQP